MTVITLEKVQFAYRNALVLKDVSFSVEEGEFIGIIGPNGGGKTTLLKLIMGFLSPSEGEIRVFGKDPQHAQGCMAYMPQLLRFDRQFPISALEVVLSGRLSHLPWYGRYSQQDKQAAQGALEKVGMADAQKSAFGTLSGGEAQRVLIARALVSEPKILLLDEPTASVDPEAEAEIYHLLQGLDITILMVTHNLRTAIDQVGRVFCVEKNVFALSPKQVCEHYAVGLYHEPLIHP